MSKNIPKESKFIYEDFTACKSFMKLEMLCLQISDIMYQFFLGRGLGTIWPALFWHLGLGQLE